MAKIRVRYKPQSLGGYRTQENQALLLAGVAYRAWDLWCEADGHGGYLRSIMGTDEDFDDAMRALYRVVHETDVYYSGFHQGEDTYGKG